MNARLAAVCGALAIHVAVAQELPLPTWPNGHPATFKSNGWLAGVELLTEPPDATPVESVDVKPPDAAEIHDTNPFHEIPAASLDAYFAERPKSFLVDPQHLLKPEEAKERLAFLSDHAAESEIDLFVFVIGGDQEIPTFVRAEELDERFFVSGRPAVAVLYYYGAPDRASLVMSPALVDSVSSAEQRRLLDSSIQQALAKSDPAEQLDRFIVQMSIRTYWMEKKVVGAPAAVEALEPRAVDPKKSERETKHAEKIAWLRELAMQYAIPAGGGAFGLLLALVLLRVFGARSRHRFPDFEVEPRLGGAHAAGIGAVISFASASVPPASQRDQMPDYLRRA